MLPNKEKNSPKTILLIGSTGKGKSTLANVITDLEDKFKESGASVSGTKEIQKEEFIESNSGISYAVIDTVGMGDTNLKREEVLDKIAEAVYLAKDGVNQIFFVIDDKFNPHEMTNYDLLRTIIFDQEVVNHTTIVRTRFENFEKQEKCQEDIEEMIGQGGKLAEIIKSCQKRVIYVDNPSLDLLPVENEDKEKKIKRETKIENRKKTRSTSRKLLIEYLQKICLTQTKEYKPQKLQKLSAEIFDYMQTKIESKKKLAEKEAKRKRLEEEAKKAEEAKKKQAEIESISEQSSATEDSENKPERKSNRLKLKTWIKFPSLKKDLKKKGKEKKDNQESESSKNNPKVITKLKITALENELKELLETKKLIEEIQEKDGLIRQKVLGHILHNYDDITKVQGSDNFIKTIIGDSNNLSANKLTFTELQKQKEKLEAKLLEQKDNNKTLNEIKDKITQKEQALLEAKKELLTIKEVAKEWQKRDFDVWEANQWADALGNTFDPEDDAFFCAWLRDNKKLTTEMLVNADLDQLRKEYNKKKKYKLTKENFQQLIKLTFSKEVAQANRAKAKAWAKAWAKAESWAQASAEAEAETWAEAYRAEAEAWAKAKASAKAEAWAEAYRAEAEASASPEPWAEAKAEAEAEAWAKAEASPETWAEAYRAEAEAEAYRAKAKAYRAKAKASAEAWAKAKAEAEAEAWAKAYRAKAEASAEASAEAEAWAKAYRAKAESWAQASAEAEAETWAQASAEAEAETWAEAYRAEAEAYRAEAQHLKVNLTLEKIKPFFTLEIEQEGEEEKVEISVSIENKPKN
jgi:hypothetical protein